MAASYNFRPALNGFNREDVVHYIEFVNTKNATQLNQLRTELASAQQEITALKAVPDKAAELEEQIAQLRAELAQEREAKVKAEAALADMTRQRDEAISARPSVASGSNAELEAYRRAERMERQAKERADAMCARANGIVSDATVKVDDAARRLNAVAGQVATQIAALQESVNSSKQVLQDAAMALYDLQS